MLLKLIILCFKVVKPAKAKFGKWTRLESIAAEIDKAVENDITKFPELVISYISTALLIPRKLLSSSPWQYVIYLYIFAKQINSPKKIPILQGKVSGKEDKPLGWDYPGRGWVYWTHLLAKEYGWGLEYIQGLDIDVALAHLQEILTEDQLNREFLWSMSEIAYPYNSSTKQSKFSPLKRPYFMASTAPEIKKIRIRKDLMPMGVIVDVGKMEAYFAKEAQSKATHTQ